MVACSDGTGESAIRARKGVILAAGGYAANAVMCAAFDPRLAGLPTTNHAGATGEVMLAAREIGAFLSGCDFIECLSLDARYSRLSLFVERCIFVDRTGRRFIREDAPRDRFRDKILDLPQREAFVILDDDGFRCHPETFRRDATEGLDKGEVFRADSLQGLARQIRVPARNLDETVERYNRFVETRSDRDFGRAQESLLHPMVKPPFWASKANLSFLYTLGGVEIDERTRVLDWDGRPIPKLFAAGEITTGAHGAVRLGTVAILDCLVFGRVAGQTVVKDLRLRGSCLERKIRSFWPRSSWGAALFQILKGKWISRQELSAWTGTHIRGVKVLFPGYVYVQNSFAPNHWLTKDHPVTHPT